MNGYYHKVEGINNKKENEFYYNQYEDLVEDGRFFYHEKLKARYIEQEQEEYKENMLIEALPPMQDVDTIVTKLTKLPIYNDNERKKDVLYREQAIFRLNDCVIPFVKYIEIEKKISIILRRGYVERRVMDKNFIETMNYNSYILNANKKEKNKDSHLEMKSIRKNSSSLTPGFALIGISGGGKTTALENILSLYPQCIIHSNYNSKEFIFTQLTYIKIDCSPGGGLKGICKNFFEQVDNVLGTNYASTYGQNRNSKDDMISYMSFLTQKYALGMLVIDEIQHLGSFNDNSEHVLNFFVTLQNRMHVPIIYCGTYKAVNKVLGKNFRQARRTSGMGEVFWDILKKDNFYKFFLNKIWDYQWLKEKVELNNELIDVIYEKTMGITDRIIKLFMATQLEAIISNKEKISASLIKEVADKYMKLTKPMIEALYSENPKQLQKYDDLYCIDFDFIKSEYENKFNDQKILEQIAQTQIYEENMDKEFKNNELIILLTDIGIDTKKAKKYAKSIINEYGFDKDINFLKSKVFSYITELEDKKKPKTNKKTSDLKSTQEEKSGYEKLQEQGLIKSGL